MRDSNSSSQPDPTLNPSGLKRESATFFFHQPVFVNRNHNNPAIGFPKNDPTIFFNIQAAEMTSLNRSSFGGFLFRTVTSHEQLNEACADFIAYAKRNSVKAISIKCAPEMYQPDESHATYEVLTKHGFNVLFHDVTQFLPVSATAMNMNTHRKRRLRNSESAGYHFKLLDKSLIEEAYSLFVESRSNKAYPITMSLQEFQTAFDMFPDRYCLFGVMDRLRLIAATVTVHVHPEILYVFFIGDSLQYRKFSPVTMLVDGLYRYSQEKNYQILDLGISTVKGVRNEGLYSFKESFGALPSPKLTYHLEL